MPFPVHDTSMILRQRAVRVAVLAAVALLAAAQEEGTADLDHDAVVWRGGGSEVVSMVGNSAPASPFVALVAQGAQELARFGAAEATLPGANVSALQVRRGGCGDPLPPCDGSLFGVICSANGTLPEAVLQFCGTVGWRPLRWL